MVQYHPDERSGSLCPPLLVYPLRLIYARMSALNWIMEIGFEPRFSGLNENAWPQGRIYNWNFLWPSRWHFTWLRAHKGKAVRRWRHVWLDTCWGGINQGEILGKYRERGGGGGGGPGHLPFANSALLILMSIWWGPNANNQSKTFRGQHPSPYLHRWMPTSFTMCENKYLIIYKSWPGQTTMTQHPESRIRNPGENVISPPHDWADMDALAGFKSRPRTWCKYINYGNIFCEASCGGNSTLIRVYVEGKRVEIDIVTHSMRT